MAAPALGTSTRIRGRRPLRFDTAGGPLVAICGLTGGAGVTTLALALARTAARASSAPCLVAEMNPESGGLGARAGLHSECSLDELASGARPDLAFASLEPRLRMVAARPRPDGGADAASVLDIARRAHGIVIADCGLLSSRVLGLLERATHRVWVIGASDSAITRARGQWVGLAPIVDSTPELVVAVSRDVSDIASARDLRCLAETRCRELVLVPHRHAPDRAGTDPGLDAFADVVTTLDRLVRS